MIAYARRSSTPDRDIVLVLLSAKAGLRACEMARLTWPMVIDGHGQIAKILEVHDRIAKKRGGRRIPVHPVLRAALRRLQRCTEDMEGPVIVSKRGGTMRPTSLVNWFAVMFSALGYAGCSSHSGRRTFITAAARQLARTGGSLRDVQLLAGHRSIETTQRYIDGDTKIQRRLVALI
jgi:integrase/recombinase XerD